ncbi:hypothetical protein JHK86_055002 [Glycine max]|nr:hypothetical protein JHK86_055002 [Glycine max]
MAVPIVPSPNIWLLDCRFNHYLHGRPSMRVGCEFAAAGVLHDKIYVFGGCVADTWSSTPPLANGRGLPVRWRVQCGARGVGGVEGVGEGFAQVSVWGYDD